MARIVGLVGVGREQVASWSSELLELGPEVGKSPQELARALFTVTSAGFRGGQAIEVLARAARASAAGLGQTRDIAEAATGVINAYGSEVITAAEATDIVTATARAGNFATNELAGSLGRVTPFAEAAGASFSDVGGAIALLTRTNNDARESVTQTASLFRAFSAPTKQTISALDELGLSTSDVREIMAEKGLAGTLQILDERLGGNRDALRNIIPDSQGFAAALSILNADAETLTGTFGAVADSSGITDEAFGAVAETAEFARKQAMAEFQSALQELATEVMPIITSGLRGLRDIIQRVADWFGELSPRTRRFVLIGAGLAAALGPALVIIGGLVAALGALFTPLGAIVAGLAALVAGFIAAYTQSETFREIVNAAFGKVKEVVTTVVQFVRDWIEENWDDIRRITGEVFNFIRDIVEEVVSFVRDFWEENGENIKESFVNVMNAIRAVVETTWEVIQHIWDTAGAEILTIVRTVFGRIVRRLQFFFNLIKNSFELLFAVLSGDWGRAWEELRQIVGSVVDEVVATVRDMVTVLTAVLTGLGKLLLDLGDRAWQAFADAMTDLWNDTIFPFIEGIPDAILDLLGDLSDLLLDTGKDIIGGLRDGANRVWQAYIGFYTNLGRTILNAVGTVGRLLFEKGKAIIGGLRNGANQVWNTYITFYRTLAQKVVNAVGVVGRVLFEKGRALIGGLSDGTLDVWTAVRTWFVQLPARIGNAVGVVGRTLFEKGRAVLGGLSDGILNVWNSVASFFRNLPDAIVFNVGTVGKTLFEKGRALIGGLRDGIFNVWSGPLNSVSSFFSGLPKAISDRLTGIGGTLWSEGRDLVKGFINGFISVWNDFHIPGFTRTFDPLGGFGPDFTVSFPTIHFPDLQKLAHGGIVDEPTLALIGEAGREFVVNERQMRAIVSGAAARGAMMGERRGSVAAPQPAMAGGRGGDTVIQVQGLLFDTTRRLAREVAREQAWQRRVSGR